MIIGQPGAGKSTMARAIGEIAHLPVFHMDHVNWMPGWRARDADAKAAMVAEIHALDRWVFEGGHSRSWPDRLARADTLIWLDLPVATRAARILRRWVDNRGRTRADLPDDCPERLDPEFLRYVWATRRSGWARAADLYARARPGQRTVHLRSGRAARGWLHALRFAVRHRRLDQGDA